MAREFRFGGAVLEPASGEAWAKKCERVEALGYDVLLVPDHLGWPAPFPSLVASSVSWAGWSRLRRARASGGRA
jgi:alkanesulfonate monooxygenase SsuD/methylene tetrahydromethanopterin reductase-like flavin-dependent oxidoreductase (luciferase family)